MVSVAPPKAELCTFSKDSLVCPLCPDCPRFQIFSPRIQISNIFLKMRTNGTIGTIPKRNRKYSFLFFFISIIIIIFFLDKEQT